LRVQAGPPTTRRRSTAAGSPRLGWSQRAESPAFHHNQVGVMKVVSAQPKGPKSRGGSWYRLGGPMGRRRFAARAATGAANRRGRKQPRDSDKEWSRGTWAFLTLLLLLAECTHREPRVPEHLHALVDRDALQCEPPRTPGAAARARQGRKGKSNSGVPLRTLEYLAVSLARPPEAACGRGS